MNEQKLLFIINNLLLWTLIIIFINYLLLLNKIKYTRRIFKFANNKKNRILKRKWFFLIKKYLHYLYYFSTILTNFYIYMILYH